MIKWLVQEKPLSYEGKMDILANLNDSQKEAATHVDGPMLILAGAGSGKTKTITTRIAYLIANGIPPSSILALTFTNKAANEMRARALNLISKNNIAQPQGSPLLCTFHKFGLLFLKFYIDRLGRKNNFIIIDTDDKKKIISEFKSKIPTSTIANEISKLKNSLIDPEEAKQRLSNSTFDDFYYNKERYATICEIYQKYENRLKEDNLVDFDDLLILPYKILDRDKKLCEEISNNYRYIMVDEYQDTNEIQFKLLEKLYSTHNNIVVVGDDDQSIYGWRGARVENILNFKDKFSNVKMVKLESNYRSTQNILNAANDLIEHNTNRLGKKLLSTKGAGEEIELINSQDESYEANKIAIKIEKLIKDGVKPQNIAILYRINALSRALEDGLMRAKIPYKMVGGIKFYQRAEVKDIISYLRIILDSNDDFSLKRVINRPKRGVGAVGLTKIENKAKELKLSMLDSITHLNKEVSKSSLDELLKLKDEVERLRNLDGAYAILSDFDKSFGIREWYKELPDGEDRVANIDEFIALLKESVKNDPSFDITQFLNDLLLRSEQDAISDDAISIMSIHASKGLEFEHLFVIGLEEGFFPIQSDNIDIEEERRLAYVALTRAKSSLTLSTTNSRYYNGKRKELEKSRFLSEAGLCEGAMIFEKTQEIKKGDIVNHKLFGMGRVTATTKVKTSLMLDINFGGINRKIMSDFVEKKV